MIKLNDLAIGYNGEAILEHIDQEFDDGLIYGILAKSGAGKTTLLKTISGLLHPVHGEVVIDGTTYRNADKNPVIIRNVLNIEGSDAGSRISLIVSQLVIPIVLPVSIRSCGTSLKQSRIDGSK